MIEVGKIYRLNAPWHPRNGRLVFVIHSRIGISDELKGKLIYHVIDSDDFSIEPDWNTEYPVDCFIYTSIDIDKFIKWRYENSKKIRIKIYKTRYYESNNDIRIFYYNFKSSELHAKYHLIIKERAESFVDFYSWMPDGYLTGDQILNLKKYFDSDHNFITQNPSN